MMFALTQILQNEILYIIRPMDKKKVLFYNDRTANFAVDEEFQKQWRAVAVDAMDDAKIDEYLEKQVGLAMSPPSFSLF
jgi:transcription initiation factor TFIIE subunit beta